MAESVSQSPLKDQAFSTFLNRNPPFELPPENGFSRSLHAARNNEMVPPVLATTGRPSAASCPSRRSGFYVSRGELKADLSAVVAPIRAGSPEAHSALALVTSSERFELLNVDVLFRLVVNGAAEIGLILNAA
jgi:hypothetical protein